ncbi:MAG: hypothetical protein AABY32_00860 [Nanoarchaeota archaeon]
MKNKLDEHIDKTAELVMERLINPNVTNATPIESDIINLLSYIYQELKEKDNEIKYLEEQICKIEKKLSFTANVVMEMDR